MLKIRPSALEAVFLYFLLESGVEAHYRSCSPLNSASRGIFKVLLGSNLAYACTPLTFACFWQSCIYKYTIYMSFRSFLNVLNE
ncbi:hypothetical protein T492DRAFT_10132 [Pavlovales sp. CCMP2436]|nr:hypothetical protein T492DRAFT_10132 [Pavlovales sp. CCMP2436]